MRAHIRVTRTEPDEEFDKQFQNRGVVRGLGACAPSVRSSAPSWVA